MSVNKMCIENIFILHTPLLRPLRPPSRIFSGGYNVLSVAHHGPSDQWSVEKEMTTLDSDYSLA